MTNEITQTMTGGMKPQQLRRELQEGGTDDLWRRRAIIGLSLVGAAAMTAVALFQTGVIKHLPAHLPFLLGTVGRRRTRLRFCLQAARDSSHRWRFGSSHDFGFSSSRLQ